jgi:hypothetical protein
MHGAMGEFPCAPTESEKATKCVSKDEDSGVCRAPRSSTAAQPRASTRYSHAATHACARVRLRTHTSALTDASAPLSRPSFESRNKSRVVKKNVNADSVKCFCRTYVFRIFSEGADSNRGYSLFVLLQFFIVATSMPVVDDEIDPPRSCSGSDA